MTAPGNGDGDVARCAQAFEGQFDYIHRALRRHGVSAGDADDLVQEVFLVMWRRWPDYDPGRPLRPWVAGIAYRVAYHHRERLAREVPGGLIDAEDQAAGPEEHLAAARSRDLVLRALGALPEKQRGVMVLHQIDGLSMREVARLLDVPLFTAYSRLRAARVRFAAAVRDLQPTASAAVLLAREQTPPHAPEAPRRRALLALPFLSSSSSSSSSAPPPSSPPPATSMMALGGVALGLITILFLRPAPPTTTATTTTTTTADGEVSSGHAVLAAARPVVTATPVRPTAGPAPRLPPSSDTLQRLAHGVVGYWRFDDGAGSAIARDLSGNGNHCHLRGLAPERGWTAGQLGGAIHLDGQGWLECPRVEAIGRLGPELTIALWMKRTGDRQRVRALVTRQLGDEKLDHFHFGFRDDLLLLQSSAGKMALLTGYPRVRERWYHLAATRAADGTARVFVDGEEVARGEGPPGDMGGGDKPLVIGAGFNTPDPTTPAERFLGDVDELLIYARPLAPQEIRALAGGAQPPDGEARTTATRL